MYLSVASWRYPICMCVHTEMVWKRFCTRYMYRILYAGCLFRFIFLLPFLFCCSCSISLSFIYILSVYPSIYLSLSRFHSVYVLMEMNFADGRESTDFLQRLTAVARYNQVFSIKPAFVCILRENSDCVLLINFHSKRLRFEESNNDNIQISCGKYQFCCSDLYWALTNLLCLFHEALDIKQFSRAKEKQPLISIEHGISSTRWFDFQTNNKINYKPMKKFTDCSKCGLSEKERERLIVFAACMWMSEWSCCC